MVKEHRLIVIETLRGKNPQVLPRGELFINRDFLDRYFPDPKGDYFSQMDNAARTMGLSMVGLDLNEGASTSLPSGGSKKLQDYFMTGYVNGPVSRLIEAHGFVNAMVSMRKQPSLFSAATDSLLEYVKRCARTAREHGFSAIALADDIAGNNGLLFSFDYFTNTVLPAYAAVAEIIRENSLFAFFHSDGDMRKVIEFLIGAGYDCIHPVDVQGGLDVYSLRKEFDGRVTFMGHMDVMAWDGARIAAEVSRAEEAFSKGGLILGSMGGISMDVKPEALRALYPGTEGIW